MPFVIAGVEKAGTTSLFDWLAQHPALAPGVLKELRVFDVPCEHDVASNRIAAGQWMGRAAMWAAWRYSWAMNGGDAFPTKPEYLTLFPSLHAPGHASLGLGTGRTATPVTAFGEATPSYLFEPCALPRLLAWFPRLRIVVVLRDPVARLVSFWRMMRPGQPLSNFLRAELEILRSPPIAQGLAIAMEARDPEAVAQAWLEVVHSASLAVWSNSSVQQPGGTTMLPVLKGVYYPQLVHALGLSPPALIKVVLADGPRGHFTDGAPVIAALDAFLGLDPSQRPPMVGNSHVRQPLSAIASGATGGRRAGEPKQPDLEGMAVLAAFYAPWNSKLVGLLRSAPDVVLRPGIVEDIKAHWTPHP